MIIQKYTVNLFLRFDGTASIGDTERHSLHSHAERGNDKSLPY